MKNRMVAPLEVGISCNDLQKQRKFYEEALGCKFISEIKVGEDKSAQASMSKYGYTVIRLQTSYGERIKLVKPNMPSAANKTGEYLLDRSGISYLTFIVESIDFSIERLKQYDAEFLTGASKVEVRDGVYLSFCKDPEGNVIELVQYADIASYRSDLAGGN